MNNGLVIGSSAGEGLRFPKLSPNKLNKAITKHFSNLSLWLPGAELRLLLWLLYESDKKGEFKYSTVLLSRYRAAIKEASAVYKHPIIILNTLNSHRCTVRVLIELGLIRRVSGKILQINHNLIKVK